MKISIITPVYNVENYIHRCIDSILGQTFSDFELILVDDGSPDDCGAICEEYAAKDGRIRVIHQENRGQAAARNRALDMARGEYIAFVDSDDWVHPQFLEILYRNAREKQADVSVCGHRKVTEAVPFQEVGLAADVLSGGDFVRMGLTGQIQNRVWLLWDKLFRAECFADIRMPEGRINEDNATVYRVLYEAERVAFCDEALYFYFYNESSTVNQRFRRKHLDWLLVPEEMIEYFSEKQDEVLVDRCRKMYLSALEDMFRKVKANLNDPDLEKELKNKLRAMVREEKKRYPITMKSHPGVMEILYPRYAYLYWTAMGILGKFKKG